METTEQIGPDTRPSLKPKDVSERLGVGLGTAIALMRTGKLRAVNVGTADHDYFRTSEAWLAEFVASPKAEATS